jgi:hypothetical protein
MRGLDVVWSTVLENSRMKGHGFECRAFCVSRGLGYWQGVYGRDGSSMAWEVMTGLMIPRLFSFHIWTQNHHLRFSGTTTFRTWCYQFSDSA